MRIRLDDIPDEGIEIPLTPTQSWSQDAMRLALEGSAGPLGGFMRVRKIGPGVHVTGTVKASVEKSCDRCLAAVRLTTSGDLDLYYEKPVPSSEFKSNLQAQDLDVGFIEGDELDLGAVLSEFLALESPACVRCGDPGVTRLEQGECTLAAEPEPFPSEPDPDPRLAALRHLKIES